MNMKLHMPSATSPLELNGKREEKCAYCVTHYRAVLEA